MSERFDVVIVGGAVIGSAIAFFLARDARFDGSILVLDKDFSYEHCATTRSAASIRHQFSTPENIRMSQFGTEFIRDIGTWFAVDGDAPAVDFVEAGYLFLATPAGRGTLEGNHPIQRALGADVALLTPDELGERFPWLAVDDLAGGSQGLSGEGWFDAWGLLCGFRRKAIALGAHYREGQVVAVERSGARVTALRLADGTSISCGTLINAAGSGARALARTAGIDLPVEARKRFVFYFKCRERLARCPLVVDPSGAYFRPEGAGFICGISPPEHEDPECTDFEVDYAVFDDVLWPILAHRVPAFEAIRLESAWAGHYDVNTLDHNTIIGAHPQVANLLFANGFSGHGLQQAPAVGRAVAELVTAGRFVSLDLSALGWSRVVEHRPLRERNVV